MTNELHKPDIDPSECEGDCENCPAEMECAGVRLTPGQQFSAVVAGIGSLVLVLLLIAVMLWRGGVWIYNLLTGV